MVDWNLIHTFAAYLNEKGTNTFLELSAWFQRHVSDSNKGLSPFPSSTIL